MKSPCSILTATLHRVIVRPACAVPAGAGELSCWQASPACAQDLAPIASALYAVEELGASSVLISLVYCLESSTWHESAADDGVPAATGLAALAGIAATMGVAEAAHAQALHAPALLPGPSCGVWDTLVQGAVSAAAFAQRLHFQTCNAAAAAAEDVARSGADRSTTLASAARKKKPQQQERRDRRLQLVSGGTFNVAATACEMLSGLLSSYPPELREEADEWELTAALNLIKALELLSNAPESQYDAGIDAWCVGSAALEAAASRDCDCNGPRYVYRYMSCSWWKVSPCRMLGLPRQHTILCLNIVLFICAFD